MAQEYKQNSIVILRSRIKLMLIPVLCMSSLLLVRLGHLQIVQGGHFLDLADENRYFRQMIPAERGVFLDRYGQPLVTNKKFYFLSEDEGLFAQRQPIDTQQALQLMADGSNLVNYELRRYYVYSRALAHVLGYTSLADVDELLENDRLKVNDWVGKLGLEREFDDLIRGSDGFKKFEINTLGEKQRLLSEELPTAGQDVITSLDPYLSTVAYEALAQYQGSVIVLDAETGQVLSLVNRPAFDANDLSYSLTDASLETQRQLNIQNYFTDKRQVFFNRAVAGSYPPGSVFKLVTAMAGLETEALDETITVLDEGVLKVGDYEYRNWYYIQRGGVDGEIALVRAIARSNDIYFYKAAEWIGAEPLAQQARVFGFGSVTGLELPGEVVGLVPDPEWKEKTLGEPWYLGNTYHFGIGQGDLSVTPIQLVQLVQTLVNSGEQCHPRLVMNETNNNCENLGLREENIELVLQGMLSACQPGGTASALFGFNQAVGLVGISGKEVSGSKNTAAKTPLAQIQAGGVGCKTGTAEFGGEDALGHRHTHGLFVAVTAVNQTEIETVMTARLEKLKQGEVALDDWLTVEQLSDWLIAVKEHGFPRKLAVVVVVESDENEPFKEGSSHSAPIVAELLKYLKAE
jgi:penicillin-binding protein 2